MRKEQLMFCLETPHDTFQKKFPTACLADLCSVSVLVKVINCAHLANINTNMIILPRNWTGGQVAMTKAKDMFYGFLTTLEHCITSYRACV